MRPCPTTMFAGRKSVELAVARRSCPCPPGARSRGSVPRRTGASIRSRTSAARWRAGARRARRRPSAPPARSRRRSSSSSGSQVIARHASSFRAVSADARTARAWRAGPDEAEAVARLVVGFRDHMGKDWPSENAMLAGVERLMEDRDTVYLLAAADDDSPPGGYAQLRFRHSLWTAAPDCWLEDVFVDGPARRRGVADALLALALDTGPPARRPADGAGHLRGQRGGAGAVRAPRLQRQLEGQRARPVPGREARPGGGLEGQRRASRAATRPSA